MIEYKEKYPKVPNSNQWGVALATVATFIADLQLVVKNVDARVSKLELGSKIQEEKNEL